MRVTIFGGHGKVALLLAPLLVEAGHDVRSVVRNPDHVGDVEATGATAVVASIEETDAEAMAELLAHEDAVVWSAGAGGGDPARTMAVDRDGATRSMDAAQAAGVRRYVMVSFSGAERQHLVAPDDPFRAYMEAKIDADEHLRDSSLDWTILAPGPLTLDPGQRRVNPAASRGDGDTAPRELVAQVAAAVLDDARTSRLTLTIGEGDVPIDDWLDSLPG